jgi:hypothetical protein
MALASHLAVATGEPNCQRIRGSGHAPIFQLPCDEDPSFFACQIGTTRGKFRSDWQIFFTQAPVDISSLGLPIPPEAAPSLYQSELDVFKTRRGSFRGYSHYVIDENAFATGGLTGTIFVTGGTGIYRHATGWVVWVSTENTLVDFVLYGRVCGPKIPPDINS